MIPMPAVTTFNFEVIEDIHTNKCPCSSNGRGYWRASRSSEILKTMYGSGIKALDDLARELDSNSRSTFGWLNSEVSNHSSALDKVTNVEDQD
ncbi:P-loop containing nucleoside triphosphate hydrolases superfamily protein [Perilla frutescens var. hirtella]|nr:P-loop containing nucleoside triphosphate hydrolases superfamily protein [Perilla frutescens var. hirtella]